ncbi:MAG: histidine phosphatase family protein [Rudaea sp.]|uniref:histidine phosphatase family protein n=1 Tax=unclassified Rudaea TaxID=2627037 RepID=UPI0010FA0FCA|nr:MULTISPECIES: histidine phosphatase family protein [unclassified Rudaea]MBN8888070.1 histidine phosphatase family protein [Rudaea sp.]MBR0345817.1 histidine phosphatase family protein [Rudaea sp.]
MLNLLLRAAGAALVLSFAAAAASAATPTVETLVFVRHGEKPADVDNGQLTCQGQNRAVALPNILLAKYGTPAYVFAVEPKQKQDDNGVDYWYLRALATIEPTAVAAGVTVNLKYGKSDIDDVESELAKSKYQSSTVFLAWEHKELVKLVANIVKHNGGDPGIVPAWPSDDYDSIYVVSVSRNGSQTSVTFAHDSEGLGYLSSACSPAPRMALPRPSAGG